MTNAVPQAFVIMCFLPCRRAADDCRIVFGSTIQAQSRNEHPPSCSAASAGGRFRRCHVLGAETVSQIALISKSGRSESGWRSRALARRYAPLPYSQLDDLAREAENL